MTDDTARRRSRGKQPKSYRLEDEYSFLDEDGSAPSGTQTPDFHEGQDDDGDDFMPDAQEEEQDDDLPEDVSDEEEEDGEKDKESSDDEIDGPKRHNVRDISVIEVDSSPEPSSPAKTKRVKRLSTHVGLPINFTKGRGVRVQTADNSKPRTRGVPNFDKVGGKEVRLRDLFGPNSEAVAQIINTRDQWVAQETFPLKEPGSLRRSFFEDDHAREKETKLLREWYNETGKDAFTRGQEATRLSVLEGQLYMHTEPDDPNPLCTLLGAVNRPVLRNLEKGSYVSVREAFEGDQDRRGWLFNLGSRIQDAQWATNEESDTQYLAVAVAQSMAGPSKSLENSRPPAFSATKGYPASIQLWAFTASDNSGLDTAKEPYLALVICTAWGAPKQLRWCPIQAIDNPEQAGENDAALLGLLAGIWSDGRVRILRVSVPATSEEDTGPTYLHYSRAAFDVAIPHTVPSCVHWLSSTTLAVATAAGTVAIWTLTRSDTFAAAELPTHESPNYEPRPWFYQQLADTFILTISSGWPSRPNFLSISTADGFARLYDLRSPNADTTASIRGRTLCIAQAWHEQTQSFIMPDEHYMLKHNPFRRYYHNLYSMRSESSITRVAASPVHPGVLIGAADGTVEGSNPVGRITDYKLIPWQQKWFVHEWRGPVDKLVVKPPGYEEAYDEAQIAEARPVEQSLDEGSLGQDPANEPSSKAGQVPRSVLSQPLARITEGYKAIQPGIQHSAASKKPTNPETGKGITVYEEKSAITALAWNPNLKYGTWAVAGMGDGLLRVEDIGV